jgi:hypothetical protein
MINENAVQPAIIKIKISGYHFRIKYGIQFGEHIAFLGNKSYF